jgi:hypothetical protein
MTNRGEFLRVFRTSSRSSSYAESARPGAKRPFAFVTLGKTIVVFYLAALMAAMISAKMLPEGQFDRPDARSTEISSSPPIIFDG